MLYYLHGVEHSLISEAQHKAQTALSTQTEPITVDRK